MKKYRPTTPSRRHMTTVSYRGVLTAAAPHKPLVSGKIARAGRNSRGRITDRPITRKIIRRSNFVMRSKKYISIGTHIGSFYAQHHFQTCGGCAQAYAHKDGALGGDIGIVEKDI